MKAKKIFFLLVVFGALGLFSACHKMGHCNHHHGNCQGHHCQNHNQNNSSGPSVTVK